MKLRNFIVDDAPTILGWCKDKHAFRLWSADRYADFPASPAEMQKQYEGEEKFPLTAVVGDEIVGHILLRFPSDDKSIVRFGFVIVDDAKRGKGYGKQMLQLAIDYAKCKLGAKKTTLGVFNENISAIECYKSVGFQIVGEDSYVIDGKKWKGVEMELRIMNLETDRILLRSWQEADAEALYKYASDPDVGPRAGWEPHKSVEESREIIRELFSKDFMWAVVLKETNEIIGCVGYLPHDMSNIKISENDGEVGYWIAKPYWNKGICTEALQLVIDYCFNVKGFDTLWGDFFIDNPASGHVMEKCGFCDTGEQNFCEKLQYGSEKPVKILKLERKNYKN